MHAAIGELYLRTKGYRGTL